MRDRRKEGGNDASTVRFVVSKDRREKEMNISSGRMGVRDQWEGAMGCCYKA